MPRTTAKPEEPHFETDEELGIGVEEEAPADPLQQLLGNPEFRKIFDAAVAAKAAQIVPTSPSSQGEFITAIERLLEIQSQQQPGYIKPLSASEMEARASGKAEMFRLLKAFREAGTPPVWLLSDHWYAGDQLVEAGQEVSTFEAPSESMQPLNEQAVLVHRAMMDWLGTPTTSFEKQRELGYAAANKAEVPLHGGMPSSLVPAPFEIISAEKREVGPKRMMGTLMPETRGRTIPNSPATTRQPLGPFSVGV